MLLVLRFGLPVLWFCDVVFGVLVCVAGCVRVPLLLRLCCRLCVCMLLCVFPCVIVADLRASVLLFLCWVLVVSLYFLCLFLAICCCRFCTPLCDSVLLFLCVIVVFAGCAFIGELRLGLVGDLQDLCLD